MPVIHVTDVRDPQLAEYRNVPDPVLLERDGLFVAEGRLVVRRLLAGSRFRARSVMVTERALLALGDLLTDSDPLAVYVVPQAVMNGITGFNIHRGCLALGERGAPHDPRALAAGARRVAVLERIANADNVGSIFRSAAAFGADAVLLDEASTDPLYRKAIRTSMGAALQIPFARGGDSLRLFDMLRQSGLVVVGLTPAAGTPPIDALAPRLRDRRVAVVLGHEGDGLTPAALAACDLCARIPMAPGVDSLNVAVAAAIALYELQN